jgi:Flp pilus assembly protein TadB
VQKAKELLKEAKQKVEELIKKIMEKKSRFPLQLEVLYQIFIIMMFVLGLDFLFIKWVPIKILVPFSGVILLLAVILFAWYNSKKKKN